MIRAVVKDGIIEPIDPMPAEWGARHPVVVEELDESADTLEKWINDMNELTALLDDPEEWRQIESNLADADRTAKALLELGADQ